MPKSTTSQSAGKAKPPYPGFPLWIHPSGRWCKKVRGRAHYFGKVADDPKGETAVGLWNRDKEDLLAGRTPRAKVHGITVEDVCDRFMAFKEQRVNTGELAQRSYDVYYGTCARLIDYFGAGRLASDLMADDFLKLRAHLAKGRGPVFLANEIQRIRCVFRYAYESGDLDAPVRFGPGFKKPSAKVLRANRQRKGPRMFQPDEARAALDKATVNAKGMILLALNCGLGNTDLGLLPIRAVDLRRGILDFPRSKTATERVVPLWPETVAAIRDVLKHRPEPTDNADADLLFIRPRARDNYVGERRGVRVHGEIRRALEKAKVKGRTTYDFRRTFQTIAEGALDLGAVQSIMGHAAAANDMSAIYRQVVTMERKRAVVDYVRNWLFGSEKQG